MSQDEEKNISSEQKKFDDRFVIGVSLVVVVAVALIVADMNYLKVGYLVPIGFIIGGVAIAANLVKGYFDWRRKKAREASGEIQKRRPSTDVEATAAKVASLKPTSAKRSRSTTSYTADALNSPVTDESGDSDDWTADIINSLRAEDQVIKVGEARDIDATPISLGGSDK